MGPQQTIYGLGGHKATVRMWASISNSILTVEWVVKMDPYLFAIVCRERSSEWKIRFLPPS